MPTIISDLLGANQNSLAEMSLFNTNGKVTKNADGSVTYESTADGVRIFHTVTINAEAGKRYGVAFELSDIAGTTVGVIQRIGTGTFTAIKSGSTGGNPAQVLAICGYVYECTVSGTLGIRVGINPAAAAGTHPITRKISKFSIHEVPAASDQPYPYVGPSGVLAAAATLNVSSGGYGALSVGDAIKTYTEDSTLIFGDSFSNDSEDWPQYAFASLFGKRGLLVSGYAGRTLANALAEFDTQIDLSALNWRGMYTVDVPSYVARPKAVVCALGVNDVFTSASLVTMQQWAQEFASKCAAAGVLRLLFISLPPFKDYVSWTQGKEDVRSAYNTWLESYCTSSGYDFFDIVSVLGDTDPLYLKAAYDSGDHLHPNSTGAQAIASAVLPYLRWGCGDWATFDASMPALTLSPGLLGHGKLSQVQEWSKVASAKEIGKY